MGVIEILFLGIGLSMDAFAVSVCKGLATRKAGIRHMCIAGLWFGGFQALMPLIGYLLGSAFYKYITAVDHWIAFVLLVFIGGKMLKEAFEKEDEDGDSNEKNASFDIVNMFVMAVATSIDALAVGITFAFLQVNIWLAIGVIGVTTFVFSAAGIRIGNIFGARYKKGAEIAGGVILILIGLKILAEHLGFLS